MTEWRLIPGYGRYEVSEEGVRYLDGQLLTPVRWGGSGDRYPWYCLYRDRGQRYRSHHSLIAAAFIGPRPAGMFALHYDDDPDNNSPGNIYYGTPSQNNYDQVRNGRHRQTQKIQCPRGHLLLEPNLVQYRLMRFGQRTCLACRDTKNILRNRPQLDLQEVSDACYREIVHGEENPYRRTISQGVKEGRYG